VEPVIYKPLKEGTGKGASSTGKGVTKVRSERCRTDLSMCGVNGLVSLGMPLPLQRIIGVVGVGVDQVQRIAQPVNPHCTRCR
jgi:hypothetical protein